MAHAQLDRDAAPEAVADEVCPLERERVHQVDDRAREVGGVIRRPQWLARIAEPGEIGGDHPEVRSQFGHRRKERALRAAEAVDRDHRLAAAGLNRGDAGAARADHLEAKPRGLTAAAGGGEKADAEVHVAPHRQPAGAELAEAEPRIGGDQLPAGGPCPDHRAGRAPGRRDPGPAVLDHGVPLAHPLDAQTHTRPPFLGLEGARVITARELVQIPRGQLLECRALGCHHRPGRSATPADEIASAHR